jgi:hypothetical protein
MALGLAAHHVAAAAETNNDSQKRFAAAAAFALAAGTSSDVYHAFVSGDMEVTPQLYAGIGIGVVLTGLYAARAFVCPRGCCRGGVCPFSSNDTTPVSDE